MAVCSSGEEERREEVRERREWEARVSGGEAAVQET